MKAPRKLYANTKVVIRPGWDPEFQSNFLPLLEKERGYWLYKDVEGKNLQPRTFYSATLAPVVEQLAYLDNFWHFSAWYAGASLLGNHELEVALSRECAIQRIEKRFMEAGIRVVDPENV